MQIQDIRANYPEYYESVFEEMVYKIGKPTTVGQSSKFSYETESELYQFIFNPFAKDRLNLPDNYEDFPQLGFVSLLEIQERLWCVPINNLQDLNYKWNVEIWAGLESTLTNEYYNYDFKRAEPEVKTFLAKFILNEEMLCEIMNFKSIAKYLESKNLFSYSQEITDYLKIENNKTYEVMYILWMLECIYYEEDLVVFVG